MTDTDQDALDDKRSQSASSLRRRAFLPILVVVALLQVGQGVFGIREMDSARRAALIERAETLAQTNAIVLATPMAGLNRSEVATILEALSLDPDFVEAVVRDTKGVLVAQQGTPTDHAGYVITHDIERRMSGRPVKLGTLTISLSTGRMDEAVAAATQRQILLAALVLFSMLGTIFFVGRLIFEPLEWMGDVMQRLARGEKDVAVPALHRVDEIGDMARAVEVFRANAVEVDRLRALSERAAAEERMRIRAAVESASDAVLITDETGQPLFANKAFEEITGVPRSKIYELKEPMKLLPLSTSKAINEALKAGQPYAGETEMRTPDGSAIPIQLRVNPIRGVKGSRPVGIVALASDITDRREAQEQVWHTAHHDALTGLPNRILFSERFAEAHSKAESIGGQLAMLLLDLDRFKIVNDTLGHPVGDMLLVEVAKRLQRCVRETDTIARLGGDEFAILIAAEDAQRTATLTAGRVTKALSEIFRLDGHEVQTGTSIGIALYPDHGDDHEQLMRRADLALYEAKEDERGTSRWFETEMDERVAERRMLEDDLKDAVENNALELFFQPQYALATGRIKGVEALSRWSHPERGVISPAEFVPVAEESGLILPFSEWVLRKSCEQAIAWSEAGRPLPIAVNISGAMFRFDVAGMIERICDETGVDRNLIEIEITETVFLNDTATNKRTLNAIRDLGLRLSLDDFGMGYSSLNYLQQFKLDRLKIDKSFVQRLGEDDTAQALVKSVVDLGHALGMEVAGEGVETMEHLRELSVVGCDHVQGYLVGRPAPPEEAEWPEVSPAIEELYATTPVPDAEIEALARTRDAMAATQIQRKKAS